MLPPMGAFRDVFQLMLGPVDQDAVLCAVSHLLGQRGVC